MADRFPIFTGGSNTQQSIRVGVDRAVCWRVETPDSGGPKASPVNYPTPGLKPWCWGGSGTVRAMGTADARCFAVIGSTFGEVQANRTFDPIATTLILSANPATISYNSKQGHQVFITSGGEGYIFDTSTDTFSNVTDPEFVENCVSGLFFDGYFIALSGTDGRFQLSDLYDGFAWNALDFGIESQFPDQIVQMTRTHDQLWLFGTRHTGPWYDSGAASFPFQPIQGSLIEHGIGGRFTAVEVQNTVYWLGQDAQGGGVVWRANGFIPERVSSHALEWQLNRVLERGGSLAQSVAWSYQQHGHNYYVLQVPGLGGGGLPIDANDRVTWAYDLLEGQWFEWGHWVPQLGAYVPHVGACHAFAFDRHLIGDRQSGFIYELSDRYVTDDIYLAGVA